MPAPLRTPSTSRPRPQSARARIPHGTKHPDAGSATAGPGVFRTFDQASRYSEFDPLNHGIGVDDATKSAYSMGHKGSTEDLSCFRTIDISRVNESRHRWSKLDTFQTPAGHTSNIRAEPISDLEDGSLQPTCVFKVHMLSSLKSQLTQAIQAEMKGFYQSTESMFQEQKDTIQALRTELSDVLSKCLSIAKKSEPSILQEMKHFRQEMQQSIASLKEKDDHSATILQAIRENKTEVDLSGILHAIHHKKFDDDFSEVLQAIRETRRSLDFSEVLQAIRQKSFDVDFAEVHRAIQNKEVKIDLSGVLHAIHEKRFDEDFSYLLRAIHDNRVKVDISNDVSTLLHAIQNNKAEVNLQPVLDEMNTLPAKAAKAAIDVQVGVVAEFGSKLELLEESMHTLTQCFTFLKSLNTKVDQNTLQLDNKMDGAERALKHEMDTFFQLTLTELQKTSKAIATASGDSFHSRFGHANIRSAKDLSMSTELHAT